VAKSPQQLIRNNVLALNAYHVPEVGEMLKLDAMENPWPWPGALQQQWFEALASVEANRYPDPAAKELRSALRGWMGLDSLSNANDIEIMLGNGSDELIQILALAVAGEGGKRPVLMAPEPGFVMYKMMPTVVDIEYVGVPLDGNFDLDLEAMLRAIAEHKPALIFLAYPNNPTGNCWNRASIEAIIEAAPGLVIADEAYAPFASDSMVSGLAQYPNLLVMRTLSKVGLAGLRLGMLAGSKAWIEQLNKLRMPYNINVLTQRSALFALQNQGVLDQQADELKSLRTELAAALAELEGVKTWPSQANFILLTMPSGKAKMVYASLCKQAVLVKNLDGSHPALTDCLRVTVGTRGQNKQFLSALNKAMTAF
jgi:histidinol-phosphate aminotransferase